jgi:hypothetical protein
MSIPFVLLAQFGYYPFRTSIVTIYEQLVEHR